MSNKNTSPYDNDCANTQSIDIFPKMSAIWSMELSKQEYWSGLPFPSPGDLPNPGTEPRSPALQADALPSEPPGKPIWNTEPQRSAHKWKLLVMSDSLQLHGLYSPWNSLSLNAGVGSRFLLQGIFPTQRSNPDLPHCRWILYQLSQQGSPCS